MQVGLQSRDREKYREKYHELQVLDRETGDSALGVDS